MKILMDVKTAIVTPEQFRELREYSFTLPTGAPIGKVWKCKRGENWFLGEYVAHPDPGFVGIAWRELFVVADEVSA